MQKNCKELWKMKEKQMILFLPWRSWVIGEIKRELQSNIPIYIFTYFFFAIINFIILWKQIIFFRVILLRILIAHTCRWSISARQQSVRICNNSAIDLIMFLVTLCYIVWFAEFILALIFLLLLHNKL